MNESIAMRVAVTRDEADDGPLSTALRHHGFIPVACRAVLEGPPADPAPLLAAARRLERYDWIVVASVRAVRVLLDAREGRDFPAAIKGAAVGAASARALNLAGVRDVRTAPEPGADALSRTLLASESWSGVRVLMPRAAGGGRTFAESLRVAGAIVDEVVAYATLLRPPDEIRRAFREGRPEAAVIASPSAARALVEALGAEALRNLREVVAIGTTTGVALKRLGVPSRVTKDASFEATAATLAGSGALRGSES